MTTHTFPFPLKISDNYANGYGAVEPNVYLHFGLHEVSWGPMSFLVKHLLHSVLALANHFSIGALCSRWSIA